MTTDTERYIEELEAEILALKSRLKKYEPHRFRICMELEWDVTNTDQLWPNGDGPENPTAEDVYRFIEGWGDMWQVIRDWDLNDLVKVSVVEVEL